MTNDDRAARRAELLERFNALLSEGESSGHWKVLPDEYAGRPDCEHMALHRQVRTDDGLFSLSVVERERRVEATVSGVSSMPHGLGIRVFPSECRAHSTPKASASLDRPASVAVLDLYRRVLRPGGPAARWCAEKLAEYQADRVALLAHVEAVKAAGATIRDDDLNDWHGEHYECKAWHTTLGVLRVTCRGAVYVERLTVGVADLGALAAMVQR